MEGTEGIEPPWTEKGKEIRTLLDARKAIPLHTGKKITTISKRRRLKEGRKQRRNGGGRKGVQPCKQNK
jgi:hypothetical protein